MQAMLSECKTVRLALAALVPAALVEADTEFYNVNVIYNSFNLMQGKLERAIRSHPQKHDDLVFASDQPTTVFDVELENQMYNVDLALKESRYYTSTVRIQEVHEEDMVDEPEKYEVDKFFRLSPTMSCFFTTYRDFLHRIKNIYDRNPVFHANLGKSKTENVDDLAVMLEKTVKMFKGKNVWESKAKSTSLTPEPQNQNENTDSEENSTELSKDETSEAISTQTSNSPVEVLEIAHILSHEPRKRGKNAKGLSKDSSEDIRESDLIDDPELIQRDSKEDIAKRKFVKGRRQPASRGIKPDNSEAATPKAADDDSEAATPNPADESRGAAASSVETLALSEADLWHAISKLTAHVERLVA
jgi:hypothetical protein